MTHPYTRLFVLPAPPDADNDETGGYEIGDTVHVEGGSIYECRDASTGAAVWEEQAAGGATLAGVGAALNSAATDTVLDADTMHFWDAVDAILKKITWANIKATLKTYFDTLYANVVHSHGTILTTENVYDIVMDSMGSGDGGGVDIIFDDPGDDIFFVLNVPYVENIIRNYTAAAGGWIAGAATWSYTSVDGPIGVISVPDAQAAEISVGYRIKFTQTTVKYFIVHAKGSPSGGFTPITIYGGTDYTLVNAAISAMYWSPEKVPFGFNTNPDKWSVVVTDTSDRTQSSPTNSTWYNLGNLSISIPIGCWSVSYQVLQRVAKAASTLVNMYSTLSTANNSESDADFTVLETIGGASGSLVMTTTQACIPKTLVLASKTSYFLNAQSTTTADSIGHRGDAGKTIIRAICAYL